MRARVLRMVLAVALTCSLTAKTPRQSKTTRISIPVLAAAGTELAPADFRANIAGTPAKVIEVVTPADDLILMVVLDLASNMAVAEIAKSALLAELEGLPPKVYVALLRAQDGLRVLRDPTLDRAAVASDISSLSVAGRAGLVDSVETAVGIADSILSKAAVRVAILYITDSDVRNYREDFTNPIINSSDAGDLSRKFPEALIQEKLSKLNASLTRSQAPLFIVHVTYRSDRLNEAYQNGLRQLVTTTGGTSVFCRSNAEIAFAIKDVTTTITNHYSVRLELPRLDVRSLDVRLSTVGEGAEQALAHRSRFAFKKE